MKRYCQTLELYDDSELIRAYVAEHQHVWQKHILLLISTNANI